MKPENEREKPQDEPEGEESSKATSEGGRTPEQILSELDEDLLNQIAETSQKLIDKDRPTGIVCVAMLHARRLYYMCLEDLDRRIAELSPDKAEAVRAHLVHSMAAKAMEPFERIHVQEGIQKQVLPYVAASIASEAEEERRLERAQRETQEESRKKTRIPVGFQLGPSESPEKASEIDRSRTELLAGYRPAVQLLLQTAAHKALLRKASSSTPKLRVLHLSTDQKGYRNASKKSNKDKTYIRVGLNRWKHKCSSVKKLSTVLLPWLRMMRGYQVDLLVIDDLRLADTKLTDAVVDEIHASNCHRLFRKWADDAGCALLAGLLYEENETPVKGDPCWEQLEIYTNLHFVSHEDGEWDEDYECDTYTIRVDNFPSLTKVDRKILDDMK